MSTVFIGGYQVSDGNVIEYFDGGTPVHIPSTEHWMVIYNWIQEYLMDPDGVIYEPCRRFTFRNDLDANAFTIRFEGRPPTYVENIRNTEFRIRLAEDAAATQNAINSHRY